jgi:hypothetical protein
MLGSAQWYNTAWRASLVLAKVLIHPRGRGDKQSGKALKPGQEKTLFEMPCIPKTTQLQATTQFSQKNSNQRHRTWGALCHPELPSHKLEHCSPLGNPLDFLRVPISNQLVTDWPSCTWGVGTTRKWCYSLERCSFVWHPVALRNLNLTVVTVGRKEEESQETLWIGTEGKRVVSEWCWYRLHLKGKSLHWLRSLL